MTEEQRLRDSPLWRLWGPYLSERQWGTVREDYSANGDAWNYFPHDHARSRAYRWGEDGLAGISDDKQILCFAVALWNGKDPILKERLFGLTNGQGNHGEDVKECYYYLDSTPTHSYLKMLYKYPQAEFPYARLLEENQQRGLQDNEFELIDTGVFDNDRYWDVFVEYAKAATDDILVQITIQNRGPEAAELHILPQLWFRNTWSWNASPDKPQIKAGTEGALVALHPTLGTYNLYIEGSHEPFFCDNETNAVRLYGQERKGFYKDAFHDRLVGSNTGAVNPARVGTKAAAHFTSTVAAGGERRFRLRLSATQQAAPFADFDGTFSTRRREADEFYNRLQTGLDHEDARLVQRQALAGMLWSKQFYTYDVHQWLQGDPAFPAPSQARRHGRNSDWAHFDSCTVFSMPDKWEYPWFAAWDLAFHTVVLALIDAEFAKHQLLLLTHDWYMRPNGQLPAYEWNFGDSNPPVHAWAAWRVFQIDRKQRRQQNPDDPGDLVFLERVFQKMLLTFTWWVNQKDADGRNLFQGGFLGLDNIGCFNRDAPLPTGGHISQSDGTSWMAMYALNLLTIALELAQHNDAYEDMAIKFLEHFLYIAKAMAEMGKQGVGLWDEQDGFFYSLLNLPNGEDVPLKVRSIVGLIPLFAVTTLEPDVLAKLHNFRARMEWFLNHRPDLAKLVSRWYEPGMGERRLLSLLRGHRMKALLKRMLDPAEFLSDYGVRAVSRYHLEHPYIFWFNGTPLTVDYEPAESRSRLFGGNSNWRGPIWFPVNFLIIESLQKFHHYYGDDFKIECPTGSGQFVTIDQVAEQISNRLCRIFLKDGKGLREVNALYPKFQQDPHFRDCVNFYEYFDGDTGRGVGASHQTGWTGIVAKLLKPRKRYRAQHPSS
ncbi:MAG: glucosidase [Candidatus Korobacteraceae bacterium]